MPRPLEQVLQQALYTVINRPEKDQEIQRAQVHLTHLYEALGNPPVHWDDWYFQLNLLKEKFYLEPSQLSSSSTSPKIAVFRSMLAPLVSYINRKLGGRMDQAQLKLDVLLGKTPPLFAELDSKYERFGTTWTLPTQKGKFRIEPITSLDKLHSFSRPYQDFCFFDIDQNSSQLYLYAAHKDTQMLGIWDHRGLPIGLIPLLMLRSTKKWYQRGNDGTAWMYVEAPMMPPIGDLKVLPSGTVNEALLDIIALYSGMHAQEPFPIIGSCRKDDSKYSAVVSSFVETAASTFGTSKKLAKLFPQKVKRKTISTPKGNRTVTSPRYAGSLYLELPEDPNLLAHLQERGYRFDTILMNSHAFLEDTKRQSSILYDEWGKMRGETQVLPIIDYLPIHLELIQQRLEATT